MASYRGPAGHRRGERGRVLVAQEARAAGTGDRVDGAVDVDVALQAVALDGDLGPDRCLLRQAAAAADAGHLGRQVQVVCNLVQQWSARAADVDVPAEPKGETVEALKAEIAEARRFLTSLRPEQFEGRDGVSVKVELGIISPTMPIGQWVLGFAQTNILFHLSMAYAILRNQGAPLGKPDLFGGGL